MQCNDVNVYCKNDYLCLFYFYRGWDGNVGIGRPKKTYIDRIRDIKNAMSEIAKIGEKRIEKRRGNLEEARESDWTVQSVFTVEWKRHTCTETEQRSSRDIKHFRDIFKFFWTFTFISSEQFYNIAIRDSAILRV